MRQDHIQTIAAAIDPQVRQRVEDLYRRFVFEADEALDFDHFADWFDRLNLHRASLNRMRGRTIAEWAQSLLLTQMPSDISGLAVVSRPQLEQALLSAATSSVQLVSTMRSIAEPDGDDLIELPAPWEGPPRAGSGSDTERLSEIWHERLDLLGESMSGLLAASNSLIRIFREDVDPLYRLGQPDL
jgi:hypothetical protein